MRHLAALALLFLAACAPTREEMVETCAGYGFTRGTPDFARCVMDLDRDQQARRSAAIRAMNATPVPTVAPVYVPPPIYTAPYIPPLRF
jgi:hypothetical protein